MARRKLPLAVLPLVLILASAASAGFLVGRTARLSHEGKLEQVQQLQSQVEDSHRMLLRTTDVLRKVLLR